jgi:hypothetical protein
VKRVCLLALIGAAAIAVPAAARTSPSHPGTPKNCGVHKVAYRAGGKVVNWGLSKNSDGTYSGTLEVKVSTTNHHAKADKHGDVTYTVSNAHVTIAKHAGAPGAGDRVTVKGTITQLPRGCSTTGFTPAVNVTRISVTAPAKKS